MSSKQTPESTGTSPRLCSGSPQDLGRVILEREVPSDVALVHPLVVRTIEFMNEESLFLPNEESRIALCLAEALVNAVVHGNAQEFAKKVRLQVFLRDEEWGFVVSDEGQGFDVERVRDPLEQDSLWTESGRGIFLMAHYMDRVEYYFGGSTVVLAKRL